jgi:hypothetical protein
MQNKQPTHFIEVWNDDITTYYSLPLNIIHYPHLLASTSFEDIKTIAIFKIYAK